jgi:uncharacterized membrane protein YdjX (TVP38/TMEM64 family)
MGKIFKGLFNFFMFLITLLIILFIVYGMKLGIFDNKTIMVNYIKGYGVLGPFVFVLIQILQVVFPIIPGGVSCLAGVLAFGPLLGFIYNYVGLVIGSVCAYFLSRRYGLRLIRNLFKAETVNKHLDYIRNNQFNKVFFWGIFLPGLPDDLLCYIAGISEMRFKTFLKIIIFGKPLSLILYSLFVELL